MDAINAIFGFINDQFLKMQWLWDLVQILVEKVFRLPIEERLGGSIHFFIYDTIKIFLLLAVLIFVIYIFKVTFRQRKPRKFLTV